jgi:pimeloyl-ACP methyl ester carboxylesterase
MSSPSVEPLPGEYVELPAGKVWAVIEGSGAPVLFLHGIPTSSYLWRNVQHALAPGYRTIAPDLIGLGKSECPVGGSVRLEDQAAMLVQLLDHLSVDRVALVAHDIGGAVAHHFAATHPERVAAIAAMNVVAFSDSWPVPMVKALRAPVLGDVATLIPSRALLARELRRGVFHKDRVSGRLLERYYEPIAGREGRKRFLRFARGMDADSAERALLAYRDLQVPRFVLWGKEDVFQPIRLGRRLCGLWSGTELVPIEKAGHFLQEDQPERIAEELSRFFADALQRSPG